MVKNGTTDPEIVIVCSGEGIPGSAYSSTQTPVVPSTSKTQEAARNGSTSSLVDIGGTIEY